MQAVQPSIFARPDTLFGTCQAIGEDLGFNPVWLRAVFAGAIFFNFAAAFAIYLGLGLLVALTRWLYSAQPMPLAVAEAAPALATAVVSLYAGNDADEGEALPIAA